MHQTLGLDKCARIAIRSIEQDKNDYKLTYDTDLVKDGALNFVDAHEVALESVFR